MQKPRQNNSRDPEIQKGMALLIHARRWRCVSLKLRTAAATCRIKGLLAGFMDTGADFIRARVAVACLWPLRAAATDFNPAHAGGVLVFRNLR
jgi:hypothetical protein